jgi:pyruvate kinase
MAQQFTPSGVPLSQLAWNTQLATGFNDFTPEQKYMRKVSSVQQYVVGTANNQSSIIATIGPKTNNVDMLVALQDAGMNIGKLSPAGDTHKADNSPNELLSRFLRIPPVCH